MDSVLLKCLGLSWAKNKVGAGFEKVTRQVKSKEWRLKDCRQYIAGYVMKPVKCFGAGSETELPLSVSVPAPRPPSPRSAPAPSFSATPAHRSAPPDFRLSSLRFSPRLRSAHAPLTCSVCGQERTDYILESSVSLDPKFRI